jgi:hypothetical protein
MLAERLQKNDNENILRCLERRDTPWKNFRGLKRGAGGRKGIATEK